MKNINYIVFSLLFIFQGRVFSKDTEILPRGVNNTGDSFLSETLPGTKPAEPAGPVDNSPKPTTPENIKVQETPNNSPTETPSGTKPAEPANPGGDSATPAEPSAKKKNDSDKLKQDKSDIESENNPDRELNDKKNRPGNRGKSGGGSSLSPRVPAQPGGGMLLPAAAGAVGAILPNSKDRPEREAIEKQPETEKIPVSSETMKAGEVSTATASAAVSKALYSDSKGPKIAVVVFDGEPGTEFSELLIAALKSELKVYGSKELHTKKYGIPAITRLSARKIAADIDADYLVTGRVSKKTETLSIISVFLRNGTTGEIVMTEYQNLKSVEGLPACSEAASQKIKERILALGK